jgi:hypothetical protein
VCRFDAPVVWRAMIHRQPCASRPALWRPICNRPGRQRPSANRPQRPHSSPFWMASNRAAAAFGGPSSISSIASSGGRGPQDVLLLGPGCDRPGTLPLLGRSCRDVSAIPAADNAIGAASGQQDSPGSGPERHGSPAVRRRDESACGSRMAAPAWQWCSFGSTSRTWDQAGGAT